MYVIISERQRGEHAEPFPLTTQEPFCGERVFGHELIAQALLSMSARQSDCVKLVDENDAPLLPALDRRQPIS